MLPGRCQDRQVAGLCPYLLSGAAQIHPEGEYEQSGSGFEEVPIVAIGPLYGADRDVPGDLLDRLCDSSMLLVPMGFQLLHGLSG